MPKKPLTNFEVAKIIRLRETGHSLSEIKRITGNANATVSKYIKKVSVLPAYKEILRIKRGGSKERARQKWEQSYIEAKKFLPILTYKEKLIVLACLYWGEGNKTELNIINSDPQLIKSFVFCIKLLGVSKKDLKVGIRLYEDIDINKAKKYWSQILDLPIAQITSVDILNGKKIGKLKYGMCRVRVKKGEKYFKLIMSMISLIKSYLNAAVVQRIERGTPKP